MATSKKCWICQENEATTGEHMIKKSDLKSLLGENPKSGPFFFSDKRRVNRIVQSIDSRILKSPIPICQDCNSSRTQPHDLAWEWMSGWLKDNAKRIKVGDKIRPKRIFPHDTRRQMRNVHLYFAKLFGGMICEGPLKEAEGAEKIPISIEPFRSAIMKNRAHREMFLQFGIGDGSIGRSNLTVKRRSDGKHVIATWIYRVGPIAVVVLFLSEGGQWNNLDTAWNPVRGVRKLKIADISGSLGTHETVQKE